jgi:hypothetical protein
LIAKVDRTLSLHPDGSAVLESDYTYVNPSFRGVGFAPCMRMTEVDFLKAHWPHEKTAIKLLASVVSTRNIRTVTKGTYMWARCGFAFDTDPPQALEEAPWVPLQKALRVWVDLHIEELYDAYLAQSKTGDCFFKPDFYAFLSEKIETLRTPHAFARWREWLPEDMQNMALKRNGISVEPGAVFMNDKETPEWYGVFNVMDETQCTILAGYHAEVMSRQKTVQLRKQLFAV